MILQKSAANPVLKKISPTEKPFLIAEFGLNHNRDIALSQRMVDAAAAAGVSAVKLQSYTTKYFINRQFENVHGLYDIFAGLELNADFHRKLRDYTVARGLAFFSTPLTVDWVAQLAELEVPAYKIASGDINNWPLLQAVSATNKPIIASTGAAIETELKTAIDFLEKNAHADYALLHCVSLYPTPEAKANISRMQHIASLIPKPGTRSIGFSDHTDGTAAAFAAVIAGAQIIEKHFTLDKELPGPDQKMSFDPAQMRALRDAIDLAHAIRGHASNADCFVEETTGDYYGKRSMYIFEGQHLAMRPRHPDFPKP